MGTKLLSRYTVPKVALALVLVSSAAGVWLTLEGIGAASLDLALAKWVQLLALAVLIGGSAWGASGAKRPYNEQGVEAFPFLHLEFSRFTAILEYTVAALLGSGIYVGAGYSLQFGERYGPWYNGLIGLQGLALLLLAEVTYVSSSGLMVKGQGFFRLIMTLSLVSLLLVAALDVVPFLGR